MPIEPLAPSRGLPWLDAQGPVPLSERMGSAPISSGLGVEAFYHALLDWQRSGQPSVWRFLSQYQVEGERQFATSGAQLSVLQTVLQRLKEEGLEEAPIYRQAYEAFASVFGVQGFVTQFAQDVFDPQAAADQQDESSW